MTAVVSPSSVPPHSQWNAGDTGQGGLHSMNPEDVTRIFMPRRSAHRTNSSSTVTSSSSPSSSSTFTNPPPSTTQPNGESPATNSEQGAWGARKKPQRGLWPPSKAEPVAELSNGRPPPIPTPSSGQSAASTMSALHQPSPILPSQNRPNSQQQPDGNRTEQPVSQSDAPAILALQPLTGTFERKQINVPFFPEVLRIGRQTNAKTVPTMVNGYFDSKVLSRQHAEVWADRSGKIWIRDVKSSNGTFVNGVRLSPENRDSEPHELREQDTLELGIDIVSEDQKSIVHHKVSAKVEHAGVYGIGTSVLDLNFGDIDPATGNTLMGQSMGHGIPQPRGRGASQGSIGSNGRLTGPSNMANGGPNGIAHRQMNLWMNPITIEQVVKRLTTELRQAKQQSQDLHRTGNFFTTLLALAPGEEMPKSPERKVSNEPKHPNGILAPPHLEAISPFSQPPAPPPQQPLPEKPDSARLATIDSVNQFPLKRIETERAKSFSSSPTRPEPPSSQIILLVEALTTARKEIDSQGDRVKQLETLLKRERKARENAEERARCLMAGQAPPRGEQGDAPTQKYASESTMGVVGEADSDVSSDHGSASDDGRSETTVIAAPLETPEDLQLQTARVDATTTQLQERLEQMVREMDLMKAQIESYKRRAEGAEAERTSLADMIEKIRKDNAHNGTVSNGSIGHPLKHATTGHGDGAISSALEQPSRSSSGLWNGTSSPSSPSSSSTLHSRKQPNGSVTSTSSTAVESADQASNMQSLERSMVAALQSPSLWARNGGGRDVAVHSAPYVSMVGVVLIGVGIMTWLNGWQKAER
ncbi:MAG: hypothetical protein Q9228_003572 [Teloschistes exilis]